MNAIDQPSVLNPFLSVAMRIRDRILKHRPWLQTDRVRVNSRNNTTSQLPACIGVGRYQDDHAFNASLI